MKTKLIFRAWILAAGLAMVGMSRAAQPAAEQLLPAETLGMFTVKDWTEATNNFWKSCAGLLWNDESMRPMREKFEARWTNDVAPRIEREFKIKLSDYADLLKGQLTFAVTKPVAEDKSPGFVFVIDTKDKADALKTRLEDLRKKWTEGDKQVKIEKIRDVEFATFQFTHGAFQKAMNVLTGGKSEETEVDPEAEKTKINLLVGQSQSLLLAGTEARDLEKILARQSGSGPTPLGEQPNFQANYNSLFRDTTAFAWVDFKPIYDQLMKSSEPAPAPQPGTPASPASNLRIQKILPALGLAELKSIALKLDLKPEGIGGQAFFTAPEAVRAGLLKILAPPAKDSSPPPFVPADAVKFQRVRIDFGQAWTAFEGILVKIDPSIAGLVQLMLNAAGKDKDPDFDLKKSLIDSLGDDFVSYEKASKAGVIPSISLVGAKNPEQVITAVRSLMRMLPEPIGTTPLKEREFLGRKIYTATMAPGDLPGSKMHLAASGGYVAFSADSAVLEEFLRNGEAAPKPLRDLPGFAEAAQKVSGMNTGWFSFENQIETMRATFEELKNPDAVPASAGLKLNPLQGETDRMRQLLDYSALPPFERVAKYFYYSLISGSSTPDGISFKLAVPTPPGLK